MHIALAPPDGLVSPIPTQALINRGVSRPIRIPAAVIQIYTW